MTNLAFLPIDNYKDEIVNSFKENNTLIITAETGSGKSTRIPQYIAELGYNVIVTEPRILAAKTLANRVGEEIGNTNKVSYHTGEGNNVNKDTIITYCTDGLQMAKYVTDNNKDDKTCLIIDEVHEWNLNIETLVAYTNMLHDNNQDIKVILMSATIDTNKLESFLNAKTINVTGKAYPVAFNEMPFHYFYNKIIEKANECKNILVFVAGKNEINNTINRLKDELGNNSDICPLHSEIDQEDQLKIWKKSNKNRIIVATNIAQTSITIPYIDVVVDSGEEKIIDIEDGVESLKIVNISQASINQRKGRAGRTKEGEYFLCSNISYEDRREFDIPEIQRLSLDKIVLKLASIGIDINDLDFFHKVSKSEINSSKKLLRMIKALDENNKITEIGKEINKMPIRPRYAKMILEAKETNNKALLGNIILGVSILECGSLINNKDFNTNFKVCYGDFFEESSNRSDLISEINIYKSIISFKYKNLKENNINKKIFLRVKMLTEKLCKIFNIYINKNYIKKEEDEEKLLDCIFSGMVDNILSTTFYDGKLYSVINGMFFETDNKSYISTEKVVIGLPKTFYFKDRFNFKSSINVATMLSNLSLNQIMKFYDVKEEIDYSSYPRYDSSEDKYYVHHYITINLEDDKKIKLSLEDYAVDKNDEHYEACYKFYNLIITIGGKDYKINDSFGGPYIEIEDLAEIRDFPDELKDKYGFDICIYYDYHSYKIKDLKDSLVDLFLKDKIASYIFETQAKFQSLSFTPNNIENLVKPFLSVNTIEGNGISKILYPHLEWDEKYNKILLVIRDKDEEDKTNEAIKSFVKYHFNKKFYKKLRRNNTSFEKLSSDIDLTLNNISSSYDILCKKVS